MKRWFLITIGCLLILGAVLIIRGRSPRGPYLEVEPLKFPSFESMTYCLPVKIEGEERHVEVELEISRKVPVLSKRERDYGIGRLEKLVVRPTKHDSVGWTIHDEPIECQVVVKYSNGGNR